MLIVADFESTAFEWASCMRLCITTCIALLLDLRLSVYTPIISMSLRSAAVQLRKTYPTDFQPGNKLADVHYIDTEELELLLEPGPDLI
jgi:hypothetical protein